ncbi:hypothetical protein [Aquisphaera insulae]|nr:hypothetical protein [Aquisphaera insulae]
MKRLATSIGNERELRSRRDRVATATVTRRTAGVPARRAEGDSSP